MMTAKVMLVDDDDMIREAVTAFFEMENIPILTAASGSECIAHLEAGFRGLILMDVMMPAMNGWETIRSIVGQGLFEGNMIVMLTALGAPDDDMEGIQEYVTDYVTKPFVPHELMENVKYWFSIMDATDDLHGK